MRCSCLHRVISGLVLSLALATAAAIIIAAGPAPLTSAPVGAKPQAAERAATDWAGDPWPLDTCVVAGEKLGPLSEQVIDVHEGREIRTCCDKCLAKFKAEPEKYLKAADEKIIAQQLPHYPLKNCVVEPTDELAEGTHAEPVNLVYKNRLVRFCCKGCVKPFKQAPGLFVETLNAAVIAQQKDAYPLTICVVDKVKLGERGPIVDSVIGDTLVRLCCTGCVEEFKRDPTAYLPKVQEAWAAKHKPH